MDVVGQVLGVIDFQKNQSESITCFVHLTPKMHLFGLYNVQKRIDMAVRNLLIIFIGFKANESDHYILIL